MRTQNNYVFRELKNSEELLESLKLRYSVYTESRLKSFCEINDEEIDVDCYDAYSRHYGLFAGSLLIGGIRVVENNLTLAAVLLKELSSDYSQMLTAVKTNPIKSHPLFTYCEESRHFERHLFLLFNAGQKVVEPSRLILDKQFRTLTNAKRLVESSLALYFFSSIKVDFAILACSSSQKRFYGRYGFEKLQGPKDVYGAKSNIAGSALINSPAQVPLKYRSQLIRQAREFDRTGEIRFQAKSQIQPSQPASIVAA